MSKEQATEEKQTIQKALLSFEKTYGRPVSRLCIAACSVYNYIAEPVVYGPIFS